MCKLKGGEASYLSHYSATSFQPCWTLTGCPLGASRCELQPLSGTKQGVVKAKMEELRFLLRTLTSSALTCVVLGQFTLTTLRIPYVGGELGGSPKMAQGEAESTDSTSTSLPPLAPHKTRRNRIPELFQSLLPLSHRHLSALIHDKLSHLIHDKSSKGPIETSRLRGGKRKERRPGRERARVVIA